MDPLINKFKFVNSFEKRKSFTQPPINRYSTNDAIDLIPDIKYNTTFDEDYLFMDQDLYLERDNAKIVNHPINHFINQNVTVLANIDAVYNLLYVRYANFLKRNNQYNFVYLVAQDDEGDFVRYIQYRKTNAYGAGITRGNNWNYQYINTTIFAPYDGYDLSGDIMTNYNTFTQDAIETIEEKYNLVLCNEVENDVENEREKELLFINKFIVECIVGLRCTSTCGDFVVHCYDLHCNINAQIVYLLALCFDSISIIKPFTTDVKTGDKYIICQSKRENVGQLNITDLLRSAIDNIETGEYVSNLFNNELPDDFVSYLTTQNNDVLYYQLRSYKNYNFDNAMMYLNLPDNYVPKPINIVI